MESLEGQAGDGTWDDGFDRLGPPGQFELRGRGPTIGVEYARGFPSLRSSPTGEEHVCIEPMTAPANALNGPREAMQWVPPGRSWSAVFRIECTAP